MKKQLFKHATIMIIFLTCITVAASPLLAQRMEDTVIGDGYEQFTEAAYGENEHVNLERLVANIIKMFLYLMAMLFLCIIVAGGYVWLTAGGNEEKVKKAKSLLINGTIGVVIIFAAYAIVMFIGQMVSDAMYDRLQYGPPSPPGAGGWGNWGD